MAILEAALPHFANLGLSISDFRNIFQTIQDSAIVTMEGE